MLSIAAAGNLIALLTELVLFFDRGSPEGQIDVARHGVPGKGFIPPSL